MKEELGLKVELAAVQIENSDDSKGIIHINSVTPELENKCWSGYYYTDYPVTLSISEVEADSFVGCYNNEQNLISTNHEISVELAKENYYRAVFE